MTREEAIEKIEAAGIAIIDDRIQRGGFECIPGLMSLREKITSERRWLKLWGRASRFLRP